MNNFNKLLSKMTEKGYNQGTLAKAIGRGENTLSAKLNNKVPFNATEIEAIVEVLEIAPQDIGYYFFSK